MAAKKAAKAKKPAARKVEAKKPLPAKAKPAGARAVGKARPAVAKAKLAPAKLAPAKLAPAKPGPAKAPAAKAVAPAPKAVATARPPVPPKAALPAKPATRLPPVRPAPPPLAAALRQRLPGAAPGVLRPVGRFAGLGGDGNEEETIESSLSLLAGPRNVKPYLAKKGEQYMGKAQLEHFRTILRSWKRDLMEEVDRTVTHMKDEAANPPDPNDRATLESEFSLELRTRDRERKLIRKIDEALARIEDGSYGYCLETGEEIGIKRLEARPVATLSIEAQERRERREKQYGDRDDRYR
jgi:RNA polymerase-binding transcription factor